MQRPPAARLPLILAGLLALLAGMWAGLARLGWSLPPLGPTWAANHGPLMIAGFLGTVIGLERAVALAALFKQRWPYAAPALAALGSLAILLGLPAAAGRALMILSSLGLVAIFGFIVRRQPDAAHALMGIGALAWLIGNGVWAGLNSVYPATPWWAAFLVLTVAGERLELARLLRPSRGALSLLAASVAALLAGAAVSVFAFDSGLRLAGLGLILLGLWLLGNDVARKTIRQRGLPRFAAASLLPGYAWLLVAGGLWALWPARFTAGPVYDAMLHSLLLGFVFSMIFGHAPIIFPALFGLPNIYRPRFYLHLGLLHAGLVLRLAGDLLVDMPLRRWGGMINVLAILLFLASTAWAVRQARQAR